MDANKVVEILDNMKWPDNKYSSDDCYQALRQAQHSVWIAKNIRWIPVTEQMPSHDQEVWLITQEYNSYLQKYVQHTVKGVHIDANKIDASDWDDYDDTTYDEEKDVYYVNPGWFEISMYWDDYRYSFIHDKVTHWMPLLEKPEIVV